MFPCSLYEINIIPCPERYKESELYSITKKINKRRNKFKKLSPSTITLQTNELNQGCWTILYKQLGLQPKEIYKRKLKVLLDKTSMLKTTTFQAFHTIQKMHKGPVFHTILQPFLTKEALHPRRASQTERGITPGMPKSEKRGSLFNLLIFIDKKNIIPPMILSGAQPK